MKDQGHGPWWFGSSLAGRFDLPEPHGTCYLAADPLAALLEVLGPDRRGGAVSEGFFAERRLHRLRVAQGERAGWKRGRAQPISTKLLKQLREEYGLEVLAAPRSDQLRFSVE